MAYRNGRFAALDIGTVTCRLLVADVDAGRIREVAKEYAITDLGVGVDATGRLSQEAIERVLSTVDTLSGGARAQRRARASRGEAHRYGHLSIARC